MAAAEPTEGAFEFRRGAELVASGSFEIGYEDAPGNDFVTWNPSFGDFHGQQWLTVWSDSLRLVDAADEGLESVWVRAP